MAPSDIVLVHGFWEGPGVWRHVTPLLEKKGFRVTAVALPSTGAAASDSSPSMYTDIEAVRVVVGGLVDEGKDVLLVGHSAGAFLGSHALRDLTPTARAKAGKPGAVVKLAFVTGALLPVGHVHGPAPFFDIQGDKLYCKDPRNVLFNDVADDAKAQEEVATLNFQPGSGWDGKIEYAAWMEIPSAYLVCTQDAAIPPPIQEQLAKGAQCDPIESCDAGHCAPVTQPQVVADFIAKVAASA